MIFKQLLTFFAILIFAHNSTAQFGFNSSGATPDNSAMVDISSETKGMLVPRMNTAQRIAISSPAIGLLVFDTDLKAFYFYNGTIWTGINSGTFTESDPKVGTLTTSYMPRWNGSTLVNSAIYDNTGTRISIGTTTISPESRLALGASSGIEGGQLQLNGSTLSSLAYHLDNYDDAFRILSGTNLVSSNVRMIIKNTGYIGIGTSDPTERLEVNGRIKTTKLQVTDNAISGYVLQSDAAGYASWVNPANFSSVSSSTLNFVPKWNGTALQDGIIYDDGTKIGIATTSISAQSRIALGAVDDDQGEGGQLQFNSASTKSVAYHLDTYNDAFRIMSGTNTGATDLRMYLSSAGNLGIGTGSPTAKLEVNGKTVTTNFQMTDGASNGYVLQSDALGNGSWVNPTTFGTSNWTTSGTNQYNALSGNVGIGTTSPTEKLEVSGKTKTTNFQMTNAATNGYVLQSDASGNGSWVNPTTFETSNWTISGTNQYNALSGNVGIGTTSPSEKLEVLGKTKTTNFQMTNGATNGYVLQSDALGNGSWVSGSSLVGNGLTNKYLPKWNGSNFANSLIYDNGTGVGIGTSEIAPESGLALGSSSSVEGGQLQLNSGSSLTTAFYLDNYFESFRIMSGTNAASINTRFQISSAGNVGIGTSASEKLEVAGKTKTTNFQMTNGAANNYVLTSDASGNASWAASSANSNWTLAGGNQFSNISGNVGIGTSSPSTKLHVVGDATLAGTVNLNNNWNIQTGSDFNVEKNGTRYLTVYGTGGNIGIGTTAPNHKLDVQSTTYATVQVQSSGAGAFLSTVAPVGQEASANFKTYSGGSASSRWTVGKSTATEAGSNAGSNFFIDRHDDAGTYLGQPMAINRQDGTVTVGNDGASATKSTFKVNGSTEVKLITINSSSNATSLGGNDYMVIYSGSTSGNSLTLPSASSCTGRIYVIVNHSTSGVIVTNTYIIANGTSSPTVSAGSIVHLVSDGSGWHKTN